MTPGSTVWLWEEGMAWPSPQVVEETLPHYQKLVDINPALVQVGGKLCALGVMVWETEIDAATDMIRWHKRKMASQTSIAYRLWQVWESEENRKLLLERTGERLERRLAKLKRKEERSHVS